jgi:hypothetical protein
MIETALLPITQHRSPSTLVSPRRWQTSRARPSPTLLERPKCIKPGAAIDKTVLSLQKKLPNPGAFSPPDGASAQRTIEIPIARPQPNAALPSRGFLHGRLSNAGPAAARPVMLRAGDRNPSP